MDREKASAMRRIIGWIIFFLPQIHFFLGSALVVDYRADGTSLLLPEEGMIADTIHYFSTHISLAQYLQQGGTPLEISEDRLRDAVIIGFSWTAFTIGLALWTVAAIGNRLFPVRETAKERRLSQEKLKTLQKRMGMDEEEMAQPAKLHFVIYLIITGIAFGWLWGCADGWFLWPSEWQELWGFDLDIPGMIWLNGTLSIGLLLAYIWIGASVMYIDGAGRHPKRSTASSLHRRLLGEVTPDKEE